MILNSHSDNKRIAKNTLFLYFRMLLSMGVSLYTSRIVLDVLGIEDFGIYGVVGSTIALFSFLNASMSGATSRFLTIEIGKERKEQLKKTFSSAITIHFIIAGFVILLGETIGLWFLEYKLLIPLDRLLAARVVYHFSLISAAVSIIQVPYNAIIIAHERMQVYAYIEILNVFLKLGIICLLLMVDNIDKLMLYGVLIFIVSIVVFMIYYFYCLKKFRECKLCFSWDRKIIMPMISFSGWDLYGNMSVVARTQGINVLLNLFFGPSLNAANAIAVQVQGAIMAFANNIIIAVRPQIVKKYSREEYSVMKQLIIESSKYSYLLLLILSFPIILETPFILKLWLRVVPEFAIVFCRYTLVFNLIATLSSIILCGIHATGKIKRPSLINGTLYLMVLPVSYIAFNFFNLPQIPYICNVIFVFGGLVCNIYTLKLYIPSFSIKEYAIKVILVCAVITVLSLSIILWLRCLIEESLMRLFVVSLSSIIVVVMLSYFIALDKELRNKVKCKISFLFRKNV